MSDILARAKSLKDYVIRIRRQLHKYPELSGQEYKTQEMIMEELDRLSIPYRKVGNTSLIATLQSGRSGKIVALRADIDALPVTEQSELEFTSTNYGVMHACGHDGHAAMLLGAARILSEARDQVHGEVRLFFQEGEEISTGAKQIIEAGGMDGVNACLGMHGMPFLESGTVSISSGYQVAGCDVIHVEFEGVSGHGSSPHLAKDTIHPACLFVIDLQAIVTKNIDAREPIVLSVGKFVGGTKDNVISKHTSIDISMRYFDREARETVHEAIRRHARAIADAYEITAKVTIEQSDISLFNDVELAAIADKSATKVFGQGMNLPLPRQMWSEDMGYYFEHSKGLYAIVGCGNEQKGAIYPVHHEKYTIDEDYLVFGAALYAQFALDFLDYELVKTDSALSDHILQRDWSTTIDNTIQ